MTPLHFGTEVWSALLAACARGYPEEACGVCVARQEAPEVITAVHSLTNVHPDPRAAFAFDDGEHLTLLRSLPMAGEIARAFFHTHPDGEATLSAADLQAAFVDGAPLWPGVDWIVVATRGAEVHAVRRFVLGTAVTREAPLSPAD